MTNSFNLLSSFSIYNVGKNTEVSKVSTPLGLKICRLIWSKHVQVHKRKIDNFLHHLFLSEKCSLPHKFRMPENVDKVVLVCTQYIKKVTVLGRLEQRVYSFSSQNYKSLNVMRRRQKVTPSRKGRRSLLCASFGGAKLSPFLWHFSTITRPQYVLLLQQFIVSRSG